MSQCSVILSVNPLITLFLAYFLLSEVLHVGDILCLIGAFLGIAIVNITKAKNDSINTYEDKYMTGIYLCVFALIFRAMSPVAMRTLSTKVSSVFSPFYFSLGMFTNAAVIFLFFRDKLHFENYDNTVIFLFSFSSLCNYFFQSLMSLAYRYEKATVLAPLSYFNTLVLLIMDYFMFGYEFTLLYIFGFLTIFVCVLIPILLKFSKKV